MKNSKGFTISELTVVMIIIAFLTIITITGTNKLFDREKQNKLMHQKTYNTAQKIVNELINDSNLYPRKNCCENFYNCANRANTWNCGFKNVFKAKDPTTELEAGAQGSLDSSSGDLTVDTTAPNPELAQRKFCTLFLRKLDSKNTIDYCAKASCKGYIPTLPDTIETLCQMTSTDGVGWTVVPTDFKLDSAINESLVNGIIVDVDKFNEGEDMDNPDSSDNPDNKLRDTFYFLVKYNGEVTPATKDEFENSANWQATTP